MELVGREAQKKTIKHCLSSSESQLMAVYGRRRVGKTFLIRNYLKDQIKFAIAGLHHGDLTDQLTHFQNTLIEAGHAEAARYMPESWMDAFGQLQRYIDGLKGRGKKVIFIDEFPWFDTPRSKFLMAFEHFWNSYCTLRTDLLVIICGSAASWMIKNIVNNKGGLHNRIAERIQLPPFTLHETAQFLKAKGITWSQYDIVQLYMTTGGIPYYLNGVRKGESVTQCIDRLCFQTDGLLTGEYSNLFRSLYDDSENHYTIIEALSGKKQGLLRSEIIQQTKFKSGGTLTKTLTELEASGFIAKITPYDKKKTKVRYKLVDHFILFYLKFMKDRPAGRVISWQREIDSASWQSWSGLAFERICYDHLPQIKQALNITTMTTQVSDWRGTYEGVGAQIDMLIERADRIINVVEIKFANSDFIINKAYAKNIRNKQQIFSQAVKLKNKSLFFTMITTFGVIENQYQQELVQNEITMEDLFQP